MVDCPPAVNSVLCCRSLDVLCPHRLPGMVDYGLSTSCEFCAVRMMLCVPVVTGMIGYGLAKAAVHQLVQSLGAESSGMPTDSLAVAILP